MSIVDLKVLQSVLEQLEEERGISKENVLGAIEEALAQAYKKEYGKRWQIVRAHFDPQSGSTTFEQVKQVVDENTVRFDDPDTADPEDSKNADGAGSSPKESTASIGTGPSEQESENKEDKDERPRFNPERHIMLADAQKIKKGAELDDELTFPLDARDDFGRIAAQTAKQVMIQKIREAEKEHLSREFSKREGEIVTGSVQRIERGNIYIDLGRATGLLPYEEQIPGERYKQGERIRAYLYRVEETSRGVFLRLSRSHPDFLEKLFAQESPEVANGTVEIRAIAREVGSRSKIAVWSTDEHVDPVGSLVGQRGVRVSTVMSELGGEKIDIVEYSDDPAEFIEEALSPATVVDVEVVDEDEQQVIVRVSEDQQSLAIGRGGQNVRLAAKLTGWRIDIQSVGGETVAEADEEGEVEIVETTDNKQPTTNNGDEGEEDDEIEKDKDDEETSDESPEEEKTEEKEGDDESEKEDDVNKEDDNETNEEEDNDKE